MRAALFKRASRTTRGWKGTKCGDWRSCGPRTIAGLRFGKWTEGRSLSIQQSIHYPYGPAKETYGFRALHKPKEKFRSRNYSSVVARCGFPRIKSLGIVEWRFGYIARKTGSDSPPHASGGSNAKKPCSDRTSMQRQACCRSPCRIASSHSEHCTQPQMTVGR